MGLLEDTVVKAKDAFDVAAKKTGEVWTVQKLKLDIAGMNSQLSKDFELLGRTYYESVTGEDDMTESIEQIKASIVEKKNRIAELEAELELQKKVTICSDCGAKNPQDAAFCSRCGKKF